MPSCCYHASTPRVHRPVNPLPTSAKSRPVHVHGHYEERCEAPWQHMAHAYTWVVEQEIIRHDTRDRKTHQWILEQQIYLAADKQEEGGGRGPRSRQRSWEEEVYVYEVEAERWMQREEEMRRVAASRQRRAQRMQEEMEKIEAKMRWRREAERRRFGEEKARAYEETKEREKLKTDRAMLAAWRSYEERWSRLGTERERLRFGSIPWPVLKAPTRAEQVEPGAIAEFLLSAVHSQGQSRKERIRGAQLRWHPDRFRRVLAMVREEEKAEVEAAAGIVARCLNDINK